MASLLVLTGPLSGVNYRLVKDCTMGRAPACDLALDDVRASRRHAAIQPLEDGWQIADLGSRNGTFLNGIKLGAPHALTDGDYLRVGGTTALFRTNAMDVLDGGSFVVPPRWVSSIPDSGPCFSEHGVRINYPPIMIGADNGHRHAVERAKEFAADRPFIFFQGEPGSGKTRLAWHAHSVSPYHRLPLTVIDCLSERSFFCQSLSSVLSALDSANTEWNQSHALILRRIDRLHPDVIPELLETISRFMERCSGKTRLYATSVDESEKLVVFKEISRLLDAGCLRVPSLRARPGDIVPLFEHYVLSFSMGVGVDPPVLSSEVKRLLSLYSWPGNVRELKTVAERCVLICAGRALTLKHLPPEFHSFGRNSSSTSLEVRLSQTEKDVVVEALSQVRGKKIHAAKLLGISRPTLDKKIAEYRIEIADFRK